MKITFKTKEENGIFTVDIRAELTEIGVTIGETGAVSFNEVNMLQYTDEQKNKTIATSLERVYRRLHLEYTYKDAKPD